MRITSIVVTVLVLASMAGAARADGPILVTGLRGARVYLDDAFVGTVPIRIDGVAAGSHVVRVVRSSGDVRSTVVYVADGPAPLQQVDERTMPLELGSYAPDFDWGSVRITPRPYVYPWYHRSLGHPILPRVHHRSRHAPFVGPRHHGTHRAPSGSRGGHRRRR